MPHIQYAWWNELSLQLLCQQNSLRIHYYLNYINFDCLKGTINSVPLKDSKFYRYQNFHFGFRMINSIPKMLDLNTLTPYFYFFTFHDQVKLERNSRFTPRKKGLSCRIAMHHFHAITSIILLFQESRPEKMANFDITPTTGRILKTILL